MPRQIITTCTRDCPNTCGMIATVEDGKLTGLKGNPAHPYTQGAVCHKAAKFVKRVYSPERVLHPLRKINGAWKQLSWDEALDEIAERMTAIQREFGSEAILYYQGYGERTALKLLNNRFFNLFGGVSILYGSICGGTGQASQDLDFGTRISHDPLDHLNSQSMILWGRNPAVTNIALLPIIQQVKRQGGTIVMIDPVASQSVQLCHHHIQPAPGKDMYLAMAAAKILLEEGKEDREFLTQYSKNFPEFKKILEGFSLHELSRHCDVPLTQIHLLADILSDSSPTSILLGWGLHRWVNAHYSIRSIDALSAISGNIGVAGGGVSQGFEEYGPYDANWQGFDLCPPRRKLLMPRLGQEMLDAQDPPIEMIFVTAGNPLCQLANTTKVVNAFAQSDFVVVAGHFLDDTADYADIFLPSTTFLEERDIVATFGHNYVGPVNPATEPLGESKSDLDIFRELAKRFPFAGEFERSVEEWLLLILKPLLEKGITLEELSRGPVRIPDAPMAPYQDRVFPTPSGRFCFLDEFEMSEEPGDERFPYHFLTVMAQGWIGSELSLAEHDDLPTAILNSEEAEKLSLGDRDRAKLVNEVGELVVRVRLDTRQRKDLIICPRGGWMKAGHGVNQLTHDLVSKVGNGAPYYETTVGIQKIERR